MPNNYFQFKQFTIQQDRCAMKVTTDACLFGAWTAGKVKNQNSKIKTVLDIGSGTGLLSLMMAQQNPALLIDAIEIDKDAAEQAKENIITSPWKDHISIINTDIKDFSPASKYDIIVSNPPFYENELLSADEKKNLAHHSSDLTLNEIARIIQHLLNEQGKFYLLLPYKRKEETEKILKTHSLFIHEAVMAKQSTKQNYFRVMIEGGSDEKPIEIKELSIRNDNQQYTEEFTRPLKDYYLYL